MNLPVLVLHRFSPVHDHSFVSRSQPRIYFVVNRGRLNTCSGDLWISDQSVSKALLVSFPRIFRLNWWIILRSLCSSIESQQCTQGRAWKALNFPWNLKLCDDDASSEWKLPAYSFHCVCVLLPGLSLAVGCGKDYCLRFDSSYLSHQKRHLISECCWLD